jgi:hypothetical protein
MSGVTDSPRIQLSFELFYVASSKVGFVCDQIKIFVQGFISSLSLCPELPIVF